MFSPSRFFITVLVIFLGLTSPGQNFTRDFVPQRHYGLKKGQLKEIDLRYDSLVKSLEFSSRKSRKFVEETIDNSKERLYSLDTSRLLLQNDTLGRYLQALTDRIQKSNYLLKGRTLTVFGYRTAVPNASNRGAGVILVNLDIITRMKSESEIAFIICHEIAHDLKGHVLGSMIHATEMYQNPEFKAEVKKISKQEFGRFKAIEALLLKYASQYSEHSRGHELQADSLGLVLYANAGFAAAPAIQTIQRLDSVDTPVYTAKIDFMKHLNFPNYPFKTSWLTPEEEESIGGNVVCLKLPDSLKTHPDCKVRIEELQKLTPRLKFQAAPDKTNFAFYRAQAQFEEIEFLFDDYEYSKALFSSLQMLTIYPDNVYLKCAVANSLYELYLAQKEHYYSLVSDYPKSHYCDSYNELLVFLNNVNSEVLKNLAINYFNTNLKNANSSPFAGYVAILLKSIEMPKEERFKLVGQYKSAYTDPYYAKLLEVAFKPVKKK